MRTTEPLRILLVDESLPYCRMLANALNRQPGLRVVARADNAAQLREQVRRWRPDVIVLDVDLGRGEGLNLLRQLRTHYPVPVIVCSASAPRSSPRAIRAIEQGALDVVNRPTTFTPAVFVALAAELAIFIRVATSEARPAAVRRPKPVAVAPPLAPAVQSGRYLVVVGASTGGTEAIYELLAHAPPDFPPTAIVQHMPVGFTHSFAARLDSITPIRVTEAVSGEVIRPGQAVIARGDTHLVVRHSPAGWQVFYTDQTLVNRHCPSVDVLFESAAAAAGRLGIGILLTGMGDDGARGLLQMHERGALTFAQDSASSVVYGMPKVAVQLGAVDHVAAPELIPGLLSRGLQGRADQRPRRAAPITT
ncbi:MAG: chemotaxis-specific protein-glutamate methyltransferase CheB [Phycisphaerae bacterium]|jgi:two-component system chemotaxis response regulator CheB